MKIIAFTGKMGAGKTTAVDYCRGKYGFTQVVKFAHVLYEIQEFIYSKISNVYSRPEHFIKDRKLLQWLGTEWGRGIRDTLWVDVWKDKVTTSICFDPRIKILCDDVRFNNEAEAIREMGGCVIEITSNRVEHRINTTSGIVNHASEAGIRADLVNATISNDGTVEEFITSLDNFLEKSK